MVEVCLAGNHDLVVSGEHRHPLLRDERRRRRALDREEDPATTTRDFLAGLAPLGQTAGVGLYHASPRDPVWEYVLSISQAGECLDVQRQRVCLIGHSHVACYFARNGGETIGEQALARRRARRWPRASGCVNPGSVGQPRDGDPRAA